MFRWLTIPTGMFTALLALFLSVEPARAHPHAWIDLWITVLFDSDGHAIGLRQSWLFDELYTAFALEDLHRDADGAPSAADVESISAENMKNLKDYGYFTTVRYDGAVVPASIVRDVTARYDNGRLQMGFTYVFDRPVALGRKPLRYAIADPTYYIEMLHAEAPDAIRLENAPDGCSFRTIQPQPTVEAVGLAAALDRTQSGGDGLGALFAETVVIQCE